jgi:glycosyltransferase involved in cell wall biosynthesis
MDSNKKLVISYAGSLKCHNPVLKNNSFKKNFLKKYFWTYSPDNISPETRSGYYLFKVIQEMKKANPKISVTLLVQFWGLIDDGNQAQVDEMDIGDVVKISGFRSKIETVKSLGESDVLFLPLESGKDRQRPLFIPGKLYEYLSLDKPILSLAGSSDCLDILEKSGLGLSLSPTNTKEIAEKINWLIENKLNLSEIFVGDKDYISRFDFNEITHKLAKTFDEVLCKNS